LQRDTREAPWAPVEGEGVKLRANRLLTAILSTVVLCGGCAPKRAAGPEHTTSGEATIDRTLYPRLMDNPRPAAEPYVMAVGDELAIKFYTNPELNEDVKIRPDGMISLQLLDDVVAAGRSPSDLDAELTKRYTGELADPQITVMVKRAAGHRWYIGGEVEDQGVKPLMGGLTLYQGIQRAGGFKTTAHRKQVILIRRGPDGLPTGIAVDVRPIQRGEQPEVDLPLRPLDVVFVPRSKIANVNLFVQQYIRDTLPVSYFPIPAF
jgi:protein involved in polysaccharide export with SLBB domain